MSLVNIYDTAIQPKSIHFLDGGDFEPNGTETLQESDWYHTGDYTNLTDNYEQIVSIPASFTTGHAYLVSLNIALNAKPVGGYGTIQNTYLNSWQIQARMSGKNVLYTDQHYTSINPAVSLATTSTSLPQSFIIVMDTSRELDFYISCNVDKINSSGTQTWGINDNPSYVVSGQISAIDLGQVNIVVNGVPPVPPPQPIPPVKNPVPPLLQNQGGILTNLAGLVTPYVYPTN